MVRKNGFARRFRSGLTAIKLNQLSSVVLLCLGLLSTSDRLVAQAWVKKTPVSSPPLRANHAMVYDNIHRQVVMFGGYNNGPLDDTWVWDGSKWTESKPAVRPPARYGHTMVYDQARGQTVLFGGARNGQILNDTWVWDGNNWSQKTVTTAPPPRQWAAMAYDPSRRETVLFGGLALTTPLGDTWTWDGTNWQFKSQETGPRYGAAMAYSRSASSLVLWGGAPLNPNSPSDPPRFWSGTNWFYLLLMNPGDQHYWHAMAADSGGNVVSLGGNTPKGGTGSSDIEVFANMSWAVQLPGSHADPGWRMAHAMAYDEARSEVVMFGGLDAGRNTLGDTWVWTLGIQATAGNPQSTVVGTPFAFPLEVAVLTGDNGATTNNVPVTFAGPPGMVTVSGAVTDSNGRAQITATAGSTPGSYTVTASAGGSDVARFVLSNVNPMPATGPCIVRTPADDNSSASLRYLVAACGKGGTITFAPDVKTVYLTQGQDIQLTDDLTIDGGDGVTIDAGNQSRIFFVKGGNIALRKITLQNGIAKGGNGKPAYFPGGGGAGLGGAILVNGGSVGVSNVVFSGNQALGGDGGGGFSLTESNGPGGGAGGETFGVHNGGGGGDFGGRGGDGHSLPSGEGGGGANGAGAFGGGGAGEWPGGFGGGGGSHSQAGTFGGNPTDPDYSLSTGGGGAGLGGAVFVRSGVLTLNNTSFRSNIAKGGAANGQGKGGALFINASASVIYIGAAPEFVGNVASHAGTQTVCSTVLGPSAADNNDVCGAAATVTIRNTNQSTAPNGPFSLPVVVTANDGQKPLAGVAIRFEGPSTGPSINPSVVTGRTNANGSLEQVLVANSISGGPYFVTATIIGVEIAKIQLTNTVVIPDFDLSVSVTHSGVFKQFDFSGSYTIVVRNAGPGAASGTVRVTDTLPTGVTAVSISGQGWGCDIQTVSCTRSDALPANMAYPPITLYVNTGSAPPSVINKVSVSAPVESITANNQAQDVNTVLQYVQVTVGVNPGGQGLIASVDGLPSTAPRTFRWLEGETHSIAVQTTQPGPGRPFGWQFAGWSDGGSPVHNITVSRMLTMYTATFR